MHRFAFDLGSGSIGGAVYALDTQMHPRAVKRLGVRIFPTGRDPQSQESNAAGRRGPRQQRRQLDRRVSRRKQLVTALVHFGLLPAADRRFVFDLDPYRARARAGRERVELHELGRAIWHISKHRGFKSNRKFDRTEDDAGKIATAAADLEDKLRTEGHETYGAWLAARHAAGEAVRVRPHGEGAKRAYAFYPLRAMLEAEFDQIWRVQAIFHPGLTEEARERIRDVVFFQRPLRPVDPGRCTFFSDQPRLPRWHPVAQEFLILQQLNALRLLDARGEVVLDLTARDLLAATLLAGEKISWAALRKVLKLPRETEINLEKGGLKELAHNSVAARLSGTVKKPRPLAADWPGMCEDKRIALLCILDETQDPARTVERLVSEIGLERGVAERVEKIPLLDGHVRICERAARAIVRALREGVVSYSEAVRVASEQGYFGDGATVHHSDLRGDEFYDRLPPYNRVRALQRMIGNGTMNPDDPDLIRYGRITNPTVHVALGQFRRVMNALIAEYGKPAEVVIEAARDMARSAQELNEIDRTIRENARRNDIWRADLEECGLLSAGQRVGDRFLRMRLWEEIGTGPSDRLCPYTGKSIALHQLHSDAVEVDHILPFEETFDDSPSNKTVCFREANRRKGKQSPGQAWADGELEAIVARVKAAPGMRKKLWRFLPGAMEKWAADRDFEDRQLHATGYLARIVRAYAETLFPKDGTSNVWVLPGRMTAMLRRRWGLHLPDHNAKTRLDHRHHALDAAVIGVIDRGMVQQLQRHARRIGAEGLDRILPAPPEPFDGFRNQVLAQVAKLQVSHRPDHDVNGRLHEDTAYGPVRDLPENQAARTIGNVVVRKPVTALSGKEIGQVRDEKLRAELMSATDGVRKDDKALKPVLVNWSTRTGHRRLRILKPEAAIRPVSDREGWAYKWLVPGEIAWIDILDSPHRRWFAHATDIWAAKSGGATDWQGTHPDARFVMRLFKNDTVQLFDLDKEDKPIEGSNGIKRVVRLEPSANRVRLVGVNDAGVFDERHKDESDPFRWDLATISKLKLRRARRVRIDELGRVHTIPNGVI